MADRLAYDLVRNLVEEQGGTMVYEQEGYSTGGAWIIDVVGMRRVFWCAVGGFPELDRLYVPKPGIRNPSKYEHYQHKLIADAWEELLKTMKSPPSEPEWEDDDNNW